MSEDKKSKGSEAKEPEYEEYPSGIKDRTDTGPNLFLWLTYIGFTLFGIIYFFLYRGEKSRWFLSTS